MSVRLLGAGGRDFPGEASRHGMPMYRYVYAHYKIETNVNGAVRLKHLSAVHAGKRSHFKSALDC